MKKINRIKAIMQNTYSITDATRQKVADAKSIEALIEILAREYPQMAQANAFLDIIKIIK